jgi:hypothetical protein
VAVLNWRVALTAQLRQQTPLMQSGVRDYL